MISVVGKNIWFDMLNWMWKKQYKCELYSLFKDVEINKYIRLNRLNWAGQVKSKEHIKIEEGRRKKDRGWDCVHCDVKKMCYKELEDGCLGPRKVDARMQEFSNALSCQWCWWCNDFSLLTRLCMQTNWNFKQEYQII